VARINTEGGSPAAASIKTQLFVSALGASSFTFALAALSQELPAWLDRHARMYEAFGGVSAIALPAQPYEYAAWKQVGVNIDYHIDFNRRGNALVPRHGAHGETDPPGQAHHLARQKLKQIRLQRASRASPRLAPGAPRVNTVPLDRLGPECRRAR
jgi:hypothetical protein